ncbi:PHP domain-containing protein [Dasania sp. GY-MA-18]|uniref:PHP domain-containing protein n=1 Tax=Dasania phycosphaerae TaxID=2950436 RepID=A0A9J6RN87_9GAMM|nr:MULTISPECIES: PHP domain-containing protein [Dasania]MCR8923345.1 PHP domain-containing protein [Dasania sp. GY-MA-18]MCZ0865777.1 PHP domain-containing protein [Dasania phycosphaerae]MCZ0869502.1 PHP domain-containing protein [Dasania phycosphaerae]
MLVDLHCHTTASDGGMPASELVLRAVDRGVELLAITDHDTLDGYLAVQEQSCSSSIDLMPGIEFSSVWGKTGVHIVGLNMDVQHPQLLAGVAQQKLARQQRAEMIGQRLAKKGYQGCYQGAQALAGSSQLGRPHFAQYLVNQGYVSSMQQAFKRYLGAGKVGDVKATWADMATVVQWITASGGVAVLAHPLHYKMTATKLRALISDFKAAGGQAIEVVSGVLPNDKVQHLAQLAQQFELYASCGSDFHHPDTQWGDIGKMSPLPSQCQPVWQLWQ